MSYLNRMELPTALILAGGRGTRLNGLLGDLPKPMMPIGMRPFLHWQIEMLKRQGVSNFILSVGHKSDKIIRYFDDVSLDCNVTYSIEKEPLGTGGAIKKAIEEHHLKEFFVFNGDTFFDFPLSALITLHHQKQADISLALVSHFNPDRYGLIELADSRITSFSSGKKNDKGLINAGAYLINGSAFVSAKNRNFSFENDFLSEHVNSMRFFGQEFSGRFLDIGTPESMALAQSEVPTWVQ